jgi:transcriptional regulator with AAA-type ATPase domain
MSLFRSRISSSTDRPGVTRQQHRQAGRQEQPARDRRPKPDQPARRAALPSQHRLHLVGALEQMARMRQQHLAVVGQAQPAGRAVE